MNNRRFAPFLASIKADTIRLCGRYSLSALFVGLLRAPTFRPIITMRLCQAVAGRPWGPALLLLRVLHHVTAHHAGMDLPWRTMIGPGLRIIHGWGLVVSPEALIGSNVTLFHGVTIGQKDRILPDGSRTTSYPVIQDEVWIGPHAIIVGDVTVGRGSRVAGGAIVKESVPPVSVVSGNPAKILRTNSVPDVLHPAPVHELCHTSAAGHHSSPVDL